MGPFEGLLIQICEGIKIRKEILTSTPQLLYDYRILHYGHLSAHECETSKSLSRIIAAIAVELVSVDIQNGTKIESVTCPSPGSKR